ncbi:MAG: glycosyltransferase family 39 protein [Anaerolineae bacterium]|nr:glycosyltransferase family 39 protein [Anaerolineae bacterium]
MKLIYRLLPLVLLFLFFAQVVMAGPRLSLTADEPVHMAQGYVYWTRGDFRFQPAVAQPPLPDLLAGAGLLLQPGPLPEELPGWPDADLSRFVRAFVRWYGPALEAATFVARFPITIVALLGGALVYRWARERFGPQSALLALTLFAFDPNLLAHAGLATTDVLVAIWGFVSVYTAVRWSRGGSVLWGLVAGAALGLALGSKTSGFFPLVVIGLLLAADALGASRRIHTTPDGAVWRVWASDLGRLALITGSALLTLWALYRFEVRPFPLATHLLTWRSLQAHIAEGHIAFLRGEISYTGWWYYYPITFLLKTPLPTLGVLTVATARLVLQGPRRWWQERELWTCPFLYSIAALSSTIDIGYRYLLVVSPFLCVFAGRLAARRNTQHGARNTQYTVRIMYSVPRIALLAWLLAWLLIGTVRVYPHYLAYFNELAGGPAGGYRYLVDSNLDWGQSFKALREYIDREGIDEVYLSYYTYADPALYGIRYRPIAPAPEAPPLLPARFNPAPGVYAIGATTLQGVMVAEQDVYDWFRHREPLARPGFALFVYRVQPHAETPTWLAQCDRPVAPLTAEAAAEGLGRNNLRMVYFDCTQSWLYPGGVASPGWYAFFRDTAYNEDWFIRRHLAAARLSYEQRRSGALPPFVIYEQTDPSTPAAFVAIRAQVGLLTFLGYASGPVSSISPGQTMEIETWWQVDELPNRPLSVMMHLLGPGGTPIAVGDGLGVPVEGWQVGDIIVQRHRLPVPANAPPGEYTPVTGIYWLDTLERWPVETAGGAPQDQLPLPAIQVASGR